MARDRLHAALAEAGLLLTEARWACENRGASCDLTAIPTQPGTLLPMIHIQEASVEEEEARDAAACKDEEEQDRDKEERTSPSASSTAVRCGPSHFTLLARPGLEPGRQKGSSKKTTEAKHGSPDRQSAPAKTKRGGSGKGNAPEGTPEDEEPLLQETPEETSCCSSSTANATVAANDREPEDPVRLICMPPPRELLRCRDQYRCVLEAIVETVNLQHQLFQCLDLK